MESVTVTPTPGTDPSKPNAAVTVDADGRATVQIGEDGKPLTTAPASERPEWLPEGMADGAALRKSYDELRTKLSQGKPPEKLTETPAATTTQTPPADQFAALISEVTSTGAISEKTYTELEAKGFTRAAVDTHVAGQKALAAQSRMELATVAGGDEKLTEVLTWAKANLDDQTKAAYDAAVDSGNLGLVKLTLQGIVAAHRAAEGNEPTTIKGGAAPVNTGVEPFADNSQLIKAMNDPQYKSSEAYRNSVKARLAVSKLF